MNKDSILLDFLLASGSMRTDMIDVETPLFDSSSDWQMFTVSRIFSWLEDNKIPVHNHRGYNYWIGKFSVKFWDKEYMYSLLCEFATWWNANKERF